MASDVEGALHNNRAANTAVKTQEGLQMSGESSRVLGYAAVHPAGWLVSNEIYRYRI